jgi:hypothetical protein
MAHIRLTIDIQVNLNDESEQDLVSRIDSIPAHIAGEGLLTGDSTAEVESWSSKVQIIGKDSMETLAWNKSKCNGGQTEIYINWPEKTINADKE